MPLGELHQALLQDGLGGLELLGFRVGDESAQDLCGLVGVRLPGWFQQGKELV